MNIAQLRAQREQYIQAMRAIVDKVHAENRDLTAEETAEYDGLKAKVEANLDAIARLEDLEALETDLQASAGRRSQPGQPANPGQSAAVSYSRYGQLKSFTKLVVVAGREMKAEEAAYRSGMWIKAALYGDEKAMRWCRDNGVMIQAAASEGVNTKGGFLVPEELANTIIDLKEQYGVFRRNAYVAPMARDTLNIPRRAGGLTAYFPGENNEITASDKAWDNVALVAKKMAVLSKFSSELAEDAVISIADDLGMEIAYAFAVKEDECGFNGTGAASYGGIVGLRTKLIDGNHAAGAKDAVTANADTFAELALVDLTTLMSLVPTYALSGAKWYCSQVAWSLVFERIMAAAGGNTIDTLTGAVRKAFMGYAAEITPSMPSSTGSLDNQVMIAFGNLRQAATLGDRRQMSLMVSDHRFMELDQIAIRGTQRVDINVHDLGDGTTAGPIVGLVGAA